MSIQNFSWIIEGKLAGSAIPGKYNFVAEGILSDLIELQKRGIDCLLSLTERAISFAGPCNTAKLKWIFFPIPDFGIPSDVVSFKEMIDSSLSYINSGGALCVHCYAGIGRTGIVLACLAGSYYSLSAKEAITLIRSTRTAIETDDQIDFITKFLDTTK